MSQKTYLPTPGLSRVSISGAVWGTAGVNGGTRTHDPHKPVLVATGPPGGSRSNQLSYVDITRLGLSRVSVRVLKTLQTAGHEPTTAAAV